MPPRYVYWTIIVDGEPTAFRSGSLEDIMPTFNRLKEKQPTAELKWFQHGKLWPSRHDAQDFMRARGDKGRERDPRQSGGGEQGSDRPQRAWNAKPEWKTRSTFKSRDDKPSSAQAPEGKPEWKPKGSFTPAPRRDDARPRKSFDDGEKPSYAKASDSKPAWKPKDAATSRGSFDRDDRPAGQARGSKPPEWKPKGTFKPKEAGHSSGWGEKPGWKAASAFKPRGVKPAFAARSSGASAGPASGEKDAKPEWKPKGTFRPKEEGHRPSARDEARSSFRPKSYTPKDDGGPSRSLKARGQKLDWAPASAKASSRQAPAERRSDGPNAGFTKSDPDGPKRKWVPKAEYKKSLGIEAKKDSKWRPGGDHVDPKQKYKDAKKAKWGRFKEAIRSRSSKPRKPKAE